MSVRVPSLPKTAAILSVLLGVVAGALVNVITDRWSWTIVVALAVVAAAWAAVEAWRSEPGFGVTQRVRRVSGRLIGIRRRDSGSGTVRQDVDSVDENGEVIGFEQGRPDA